MCRRSANSENSRHRREKNLWYPGYARLRVVPHFFTRARVSLTLLSLRKNGGLLVAYMYLTTECRVVLGQPVVCYDYAPRDWLVSDDFGS